jgi:hypothetical protein
LEFGFVDHRAAAVIAPGSARRRCARNRVLAPDANWTRFEARRPG